MITLILKIKRVSACILTLAVSLVFFSIILTDFISSRANNRLKEIMGEPFGFQIADNKLTINDNTIMTIDSGSLMTDLSIALLKKDSPMGYIFNSIGAILFNGNYILNHSRNSELHYNLSRCCERIMDVLIANKNKLIRQDDSVGQVIHDKRQEQGNDVRISQSAFSDLVSDYYLLAISECQTAIDLSPEVSDYHIKLAQLYSILYRESSIPYLTFNKGTQYSASKVDIVNEFERSIILNSNHDYPHYTYANWLFTEMKGSRLNKSEYIKQSGSDQLSTPNFQLLTNNVFLEYRAVLSLNPSWINEVLEKFMSITHDYSELKRLLVDNPENHYKLAVFLQERGYWHQNIPAFLDDMEQTRSKILNSQIAGSKYQNSIPSLFPYYWILASGLIKDGEKKKAIELLREYIKENKQLVVNNYEHRKSQTRPAYKIKLSNHKSPIISDLAKAHFWIADWAFYGGKKYGYGWDFVKYHHLKALELDPENNFYRLWYAIHLIIKKEYKLAIKHLDIILKENPEHAEAHFRLGQCYEGLDILDIALRHYKKANSLAPDNEEYVEHYNSMRE